MDDCDIRVEGLTVGDHEVWFSGCVVVKKGARFDAGKGSSVASVAVESLDNPVVTRERALATGGDAAHGVNVGVGWDGGVAEGTLAGGEEAMNWDA